jgi:hypothetical protein
VISELPTSISAPNRVLAATKSRHRNQHGAKVLSAAAPLTEDHALRFAPVLLDARKKFSGLFASSFENVETIIRAAVVWPRVAAVSGDVQLQPTSTASYNPR